MNEKYEALITALNNILFLQPSERLVHSNTEALVQVKAALDAIFAEDHKTCKSVRITQNTDKQFFGVRVSPVILPGTAIAIICADNEPIIDFYEVEFDSKIFNLGFTAEEIAAVMIYNIATCVTNPDIIAKVRSIIDGYALSDDYMISIRDSMDYIALITFGIKDTMFKLSDIIFKDSIDELESTKYIVDDMVEFLSSAKDKLSKAAFGVGRDFRSDKPVVLGWMLTVFKNMKINSRIVWDTLTDAKAFSGSKLEVEAIEAALGGLNRINSTLMLNEKTKEQHNDLTKVIDESNISGISEISLFKSLKRNGLRGIENDLFEYSMRVKNCTDAEDAYLVMRSLNSRIGILEDYLYSEALSPSDQQHWEMVLMKYKELRMVLSKKKFNDKQYGLFFDYSALDKLDNPNNDIM